MTSVADLLDLVAERLDEVSRQVAHGVGPSADTAAAAWPDLVRAGVRLVRTAGGHLVDAGLDTAIQEVTQAAAAPNGGTGGGVSDDQADPALRHVGQLFGVAGDLMATGSGTRLSTSDRAAAATQAASLLAAAAQVTAQATIPALRHAAVAASAGEVTYACARLIDTGRPGTTGQYEDLATTERPSVRPDQPLTRLEAAVYDWHHETTAATARPDPSVRDLQVSAVSAGRLIALARLLTAAHAHSLPADASARVDAAQGQLHTAGRSWSAVDRAWRPLQMTGRPSASLIVAAQALDQAAAGVARPGTRWATPDELATSSEAPATLRTARLAAAAVRDVARNHSARTEQCLRAGWVLGAADALPATVERIRMRGRGRWVPLDPDEASGLTLAYRNTTAATTLAATTLRLATGADPARARRARDLLSAIEQRGPGQTPDPRARPPRPGPSA